MKEGTAFRLGKITIEPGKRKNIKLKIGELYSGVPVYIPLMVFHGPYHGPVVYVTATIHGDELNGLESIRIVASEIDPTLLSGTILFVPISNPIAFLTQSRDLPDGRDLNRFFPGKKDGSMASYLASIIFNKVVRISDFGIDLHTAGRGRVNLPHVRADLSNSRTADLAYAFGCETIIDHKGENGMLRREATKLGIPSIVFEAGEPLKADRWVIEKGAQGVRNVLASYKMYNFQRVPASIQLIVNSHKWMRASKGGVLLVEVQPGEVVSKGQVIASIVDTFGKIRETICSPYNGLIVSVNQIPAASPGTPVAHIIELTETRYRVVKSLVEKMHIFGR